MGHDFSLRSVPLIEKSRASCPSGMFSANFIRQVNHNHRTEYCKTKNIRGYFSILNFSLRDFCRFLTHGKVGLMEGTSLLDDKYAFL